MKKTKSRLQKFIESEKIIQKAIKLGVVRKIRFNVFGVEQDPIYVYKRNYATS